MVYSCFYFYYNFISFIQLEFISLFLQIAYNPKGSVGYVWLGIFW